MELREILSNAPDILLSDIRPKSRFIDYLIRTGGISTVYQLKNLSDKQILRIPLMGINRLNHLKKDFSEWAENGYKSINRIDILDPKTVERGLAESVFLRDENIEAVFYRSIGRTYEDIGEYLRVSRQGVKIAEDGVVKRFTEWYENNNLYGRIGNMDNFIEYCEQIEYEHLAKASQYIARIVRNKKMQPQ